MDDQSNPSSSMGQAPGDAGPTPAFSRSTSAAGKSGRCLDLATDRDTVQAFYDVLRWLAGGLAVILEVFTVYHLVAPALPSTGMIIALDQVVVAAYVLTYWLAWRRKLPLFWAHPLCVALGLLTSVNIFLSVLLQGDGGDLRYLQAGAVGAGAIALSCRGLAVMLAGNAILGATAASLVCQRAGFADFLVMQAATSLFSIVIFHSRARSQRTVLLHREQSRRAAEELGCALARAELEFARHHDSEAKRRKLEDQLRQSQKLEALGTLAGGVAHDMNNVLGAITAVTSTALQAMPPEAQAREELNEVLMAARRGATLTRNFLTLAHRNPHRSVPFAIDTVVHDLEALLLRTLPKNVTLDVRCEAGHFSVNGDPDGVSHLLMNLCLNAADAIGSHDGHIRVATRYTELDPAAAEKYGARPGLYAKLEVSDDGGGIPAEVLPHVLEPYFSTKSHMNRSGLGLWMAYGTAQQHHGGIGIQSAVGEGTTVTVVLPAQRFRASDAARARARTPWADPSRNVLLFVDDEPMLRRAGRRLGVSLGFEVLVAENGQEALELYAKHRSRIGAVVLDVAMPLMNGEDCFRALRALSPKLPIVIASGFPKDHDVQALLSEPRSRYVAKPYEKADLAQALAEVLEEPEPRPSLPSARPSTGADALRT